MDNNTPDQFNHLSNRELLEIVHRPSDYRPEAVAAAELILRERDITTAEREEVEQQFRGLEESEQLHKEKVQASREKVLNFFQPILHPDKGGSAVKWLNIFLLVIALQYAWYFYESVVSCFQFVSNVVECTQYGVRLSDNRPGGFFHCAAAYWQPDILLTYANLAYIPVLLFLLYARRKWGWILLFADNLIGWICRTAQLYFYFSYPFLHFSMSGFLFLQFFRIAILLFLYRKDIRALFDIDRSIALRTAGISTLLALAFLGLLVVLSH